MSENKNIFETLFEINVNKHKEEKPTWNPNVKLSYLSWTYAWSEVKKKFNNVQYTIKLFGEKQLPYVFDEGVGYMVFTDVTIEGLTHTMWLPVMDGANNAMKDKPYTYDTKLKKGIKVEAATMFDINKTIMRCLVKNLAMFGLGLYIYAGEDLPETEVKEIQEKKSNKALSDLQKQQINERITVLAELENLSKKEITDKLEKTIGKKAIEWNDEDYIFIMMKKQGEE